jgi:hypothetical protein
MITNHSYYSQVCIPFLLMAISGITFKEKEYLQRCCFLYKKYLCAVCHDIKFCCFHKPNDGTMWNFELYGNNRVNVDINTKSQNLISSFINKMATS